MAALICGASHVSALPLECLSHDIRSTHRHQCRQHPGLSVVKHGIARLWKLEKIYPGPCFSLGSVSDLLWVLEKDLAFVLFLFPILLRPPFFFFFLAISTSPGGHLFCYYFEDPNMWLFIFISLMSPLYYLFLFLGFTFGMRLPIYVRSIAQLFSAFLLF